MTLRRICSMEEWKEYNLGDLVELKNGVAFKSSEFIESGIPVIKIKNVKPNKILLDDLSYVSEHSSQNKKCFDILPSDILITMTGNRKDGGPDSWVGKVALFGKSGRYLLNQRVSAIRVKRKDLVEYQYLAYLLSCWDAQLYFVNHSNSSGGQANISPDVVYGYNVTLPSLSEQTRIAAILSSLDDKIEVNRRINDNFYFAFFEVILIWLLTSLRNDNLEQQAMAIFDMMFPAVALGDDVIGNAITPKRGKGLLSKDAVKGIIPVVAGGLEPATYHNEPNTVAPVVTISASGANAGFVNLWQIPVWSSDSSFIDASMTKNVYFWYVMLKKRQKEIFDAQTGSAQPHIYPKHIAEMPLGIFEQTDVEKFTEIVTPMFEMRGRNLKESERLASIRDTLLPKLMSGELKLNEINV